MQAGSRESGHAPETEWPFFAGGAAMRPDRGAVYYLQCVQIALAVGQRPVTSSQVMPTEQAVSWQRLMQAPVSRSHTSCAGHITPLHGLRTSLQPLPPGSSKVKGTRYIDIREGDEIDEAQMANWVKQAASIPGWVP